LVAVLRDARSLLALPANDFAWPSWPNDGAALRGLDGLIRAIEAGQLPPRCDLSILFTPTCPIEDVSLSRDWAHAFSMVASRFEAAAERVYPHQLPSPSNETINDEIAVLRSCLLGTPQPPVVWPTTTLPGGLHTDADLARIDSFLEQELPGLERETLADFLEANRKPCPVAPDLTLDGQVVCINAEEMQDLLSGRGDCWERYRARHPGRIGLIEFSRVGFNRNRTQALLYTGSRMHWKAGEGGYHLLTKSAKGWSKVAGALAWVS
jgi:hypothetical protein